MTLARSKKNRERERKHLIKSLSGYDLWFDVDGTLALAVDPIFKKFNQDYNTQLTVADYTGFWVLGKQLMLAYPNMDEETARHKEYWDYWANEELLSQAPVIPNALDVIQRLSAIQEQANLTINIITSREPHLVDCTHQWLNNNGFLEYVELKNIHHRGPRNSSGRGFKKSKVRGGIVFEDSVYEVERILDGDEQGTWVVWLPYLEDIGKLDHPRLVTVKETCEDRDFKHVYQELLRRDFSEEP